MERQTVWTGAVVPVAGGPGRDRGAPAGRRVRLPARRDDRAASRGRAMGRCGRSLARQELVTAQRARPLLTYARPYLAVQVRANVSLVGFPGQDRRSRPV